MKKDITDYPKVSALLNAIESGNAVIAVYDQTSKNVEIYLNMPEEPLKATIAKLQDALPKNEAEPKRKSR